MKKITLLFIFVLAFVVSANSQNVCPVDYEKQADVKLYVVNNLSQADLCVYNVNNEGMTDIDNGKWHFVNYENQAQMNVYFVDNENKADLKVYFVDNENQAGWKKRSKDYMVRK
jgi:hypothetical protein